tara:strand:- start:1817 stop:3265 length:1449 start_codon:yes stop_codon:yes gene_type:complete
MAIAPVNKFISVAVPVSPGKQKLYEVPTGTSALLLYVQVTNVGIGVTFPTVTFTQQRTQRSTGNKREVRVIKDVEIPPNDAAILVDGRLVLEKTPIIQDKIFIEANQQQVGIITFVDYHEPTGIVTINTKEPHPFKAGDPITLAGIALTCKPGQTGITTNLFPDPPQSYIVESIEGFVGTSKTFTSFIGGSKPIGITNKDYSHYYNSAIHYYKRSRTLAIEVVSAADVTVDGYIKKSSETGTSYNPNNGILTVKSTNHGFSNGDLIRLEEKSFAFTCLLDNNGSVKKYPRNSGDGVNDGKPDYAYGRILELEFVDSDTFKVFIGTSSDTSVHTYVDGDSLTDNIHKIGTRYNVEYAVYYGGGSSRSPDDQVVETYNLRAGELVIKTDVEHKLQNGDKIRIIDNGLYFACSMDNAETEHSYPRVTDPASDAELTVSGGATGGNYNPSTNSTTFVVNVGESTSGGFFAPLEMELIASILENSSA